MGRESAVQWRDAGGNYMRNDGGSSEEAVPVKGGQSEGVILDFLARRLATLTLRVTNVPTSGIIIDSSLSCRN